VLEKELIKKVTAEALKISMGIIGWLDYFPKPYVASVLYCYVGFNGEKIL
jgi:hypothetical protein